MLTPYLKIFQIQLLFMRDLEASQEQMDLIMEEPIRTKGVKQALSSIKKLAHQNFKKEICGFLGFDRDKKEYLVQLEKNIAEDARHSVVCEKSAISVVSASIQRANRLGPTVIRYRYDVGDIGSILNRCRVVSRCCLGIHDTDDS